ncbi:hypothetical protein HPP92_011130 [Vanilla planifolia]|uniref:Uncharacterized protein n=1 Tax=Vanilla planifolia TaxID=51239 RepID=A0A835R518_VANPL|nr:hypothetical protein HPP92_011130 [Vanilla planifolia]
MRRCNKRGERLQELACCFSIQEIEEGFAAVASISAVLAQGEVELHLGKEVELQGKNSITTTKLEKEINYRRRIRRESISQLSNLEEH